MFGWEDKTVAGVKGEWLEWTYAPMEQEMYDGRKFLVEPGDYLLVHTLRCGEQIILWYRKRMLH